MKTRWSGPVLCAVVLTTSALGLPSASAAQSYTVTGTVLSAGGTADDDAFVYVEQRLPAGARDAIYDDADGSWYSAYGDEYDPDGTAPGHITMSLVPGTYRITAVAEADDESVDVWEGVVTVASANQELPTMRLGDLLECTGTSSPSGPNLVGSTLTATGGVFSATSGVTPTYQWYRRNPADPNLASASTRIEGARGSTYQLQGADLGQQVSVTVSGLSEHGNASCDSVDSSPVFPAPVRAEVPNPAHFGAGQDLPTGPRRVGTRLQAPRLVGLPATSTVRYQWFRRHPGAQPIHGAQGSSYRLHRADRGTRVYVIVRVTDPSYEERSVRSGTVRVR